MAEILVSHKEKKALKELFNVSYPTIRDALNGKTKSQLANKIRKTALIRGGAVKQHS